MKKSLFESYLQTIAPKNIKICDTVTKNELITGLSNSLFEQSTNTTRNPMEYRTAIDLHSSAPRIEVPYYDAKGNIKSRTMTGIADTSAKQVSGGGGFSGDVNSGAGATFSQRLGTPAILYNGNYNELSENQLKALQSIFSPDEIKEIYESSSADKHSVSLRPLYVTEADVLTGKGEKRSVKAYLDADGIYPIQLPFGFLNSMYTRNDEGNHTTQYKTGKAMIQMIPNQGNNYYMDLGNGRIAFFVQIPGENGVFLLSNNQINRAVFAIG